MWRLTERMVRSTLVTACRLATSPTSTSPDLANATTDGVVRAPSAFAMTVGSPPSRTATTLFVVPRSMPTARAMVCYLRGVVTAAGSCVDAILRRWRRESGKQVESGSTQLRSRAQRRSGPSYSRIGQGKFSPAARPKTMVQGQRTAHRSRAASDQADPVQQRHLGERDRRASSVVPPTSWVSSPADDLEPRRSPARSSTAGRSARGPFLRRDDVGVDPRTPPSRTSYPVSSRSSPAPLPPRRSRGVRPRRRASSRTVGPLVPQREPASVLSWTITA